MTSDAARREDALEDEARQRQEEISATEELAARGRIDDADLSPDAEIAQVHRSGRQHDHSDTAAYQSRQDAARQRRGPRR